VKEFWSRVDETWLNWFREFHADESNDPPLPRTPRVIASTALLEKMVILCVGQLCAEIAGSH
jgi:hypothetical protein